MILKKAFIVLLVFSLLIAPAMAETVKMLDFDTLEGIDNHPSETASNPGGSKSRSDLSPSQIYKTISPAVVVIVIKSDDKIISHGSGFLVKENGFILTNHHVIESKSVKAAHRIRLEVITQNGIHHTGQIVKTDPEIDLALLKINGNNFPYTNLGNVNNITTGEVVYIIGTPERLEFKNSITSGIISGMDRIKSWIQTSAIIHGGNSGGPAINAKGKVIGVAVAVALGLEKKGVVDSKGNVKKISIIEKKEGISFIIPINYANNLLNLMY